MFLINPYILQASGNPLWNGLQAYYTADNTPNDALGTHNGTLVNGTTYGTGKINQGFIFDGVNDYIDTSAWYRKSKIETFTYSAWVLHKDLGSNMILGNVPDIYSGHLFWLSGDNVYINIGNSSSSRLTVRSNSIFTENVYNHIVVTYDGSATPSGFKIYKNGALDTTVTISNTLGANDTPVIPANFVIGRSGSGVYHFGSLDEVGVWNRVLTPSEAAELYNSGAGKQYPN